MVSMNFKKQLVFTEKTNFAKDVEKTNVFFTK